MIPVRENRQVVMKFTQIHVQIALFYIIRINYPYQTIYRDIQLWHVMAVMRLMSFMGINQQKREYHGDRKCLIHIFF